MRKAALKQLKLIGKLRAVIRCSGPRLSERLAARPAAPRGEGFGYGSVFEHWAAELAAVERELTEAELAYERAKWGLERVRARVDRADWRLYEEVAGVRMAMCLADERLVMAGRVVPWIKRGLVSLSGLARGRGSARRIGRIGRG